MIVAVESDIVEGRKIRGGSFLYWPQMKAQKKMVCSPSKWNLRPSESLPLFVLFFYGKFIGKLEGYTQNHEMKRVCPSSMMVNPNLVRGCSLSSSSSHASHLTTLLHSRRASYFGWIRFEHLKQGSDLKVMLLHCIRNKIGCGIKRTLLWYLSPRRDPPLNNINVSFEYGMM